MEKQRRKDIIYFVRFRSIVFVEKEWSGCFVIFATICSFMKLAALYFPF